MAIRSWVALGAVLAGVGAVHAAPVPYQAALTRWRASDGGFASWERSGVVMAPDGSLRLDPATAQPGTDPYPAGGYNGRNFYNVGAFIVGEATSPVTATSFAFKEAIGSWNAATPAGTWVETLVRARLVLGARSFQGSLREVALRPAASDHGRWLTRGTSTDRQPVYDPGGEWIVFSSNRGGNLDLWAVSRSTAAVRRLTDDAAEDWDPAFTPDGKLLWSSNRTGSFEVWTAEADGTAARQVTREGADAENPVATPDGRWILYASSSVRSRGIMRIRPDGSQAALHVPGNVLLPEVSPDGRYLAFVADLGAERAALRVALVSDGSLVPFEIPLPAWRPAHGIDLGRCRWLPDGRGLAFIGQEPDGTYGVYVQEFAPGGGTAASRRFLAFDPDRAAESFGISPDGAHLTVTYWDQVSNLMLADNVAGVDRPGAER